MLFKTNISLILKLLSLIMTSSDDSQQLKTITKDKVCTLLNDSIEICIRKTIGGSMFGNKVISSYLLGLRHTLTLYKQKEEFDVSHILNLFLRYW